MKTKAPLRYSAEFKTKVVFELLLSGISLQELSSKYEVSIENINAWKKQMIESASAIFSTRKSSQKDEKEIKILEKKRDVLKKSIDAIQRKNANAESQGKHYYVPQDILHQFIAPTNRPSQIKNSYIPLIS